MSKIVALLVSDLHISAAPPVVRAVGATEEERRSRWRRAMSRQLKQLHALAIEYQVPVIVAGDVFDTCRESSGIVNWLLARIPDNVKWYGVSGQHDQPNHQLDRLKESPYWTLVEAGKLVNLEPDEPVEVPGVYPLRLHGFPYGVRVKPLKADHTSALVIDVAVVHTYIWTKDKGYPGAPEDCELLTFSNQMLGYDAVVVGDNHKHFRVRGSSPLPTTLWNCGSFLRRTIDEEGHRPCVGLLRSNGTVKRHWLDTSKDKWNRTDGGGVTESKEEIDVRGLVRELRAGKTAVDFVEAIIRWLRANPVSEEVRREIMEATEGK